MKTLHQVQSPPASPPLPFMLDDLTVEILSWLPVKSLLQFRCVCKSWKSTISDPKFVKLHLHRSARNANLLLVKSREPHGNSVLVPCSVNSLLGNPSSIINEEYCFPLYGSYDVIGSSYGYKYDVIGSSYGYKYDVIGSCNGLVCLLGYSNQDWFTEYHFCLCNPATKLTSRVFSRLRVSDSYYNHRFAAFAFAFGYDNLSDTYKVLAFFVNPNAKEESKKKQVKIFSLGDNCWRDVHGFPDNPFYIFNHSHNKGVYFNNTLNWLTSCNVNSDVISQLVIVSLHVGMETCTQLLPPHHDEALPIDPTIGVLMNCLCFCHDSNGTHFVVWQMKEFGVEKSWTQFMKVSYQDLHFDCLGFPLIPLCTSAKGDVLITTTIAEFQAILYHRSDNRIEQTKLPKYIHWHYTVGYVESLVSPSSVTDSQAWP